MLVMILGPLGGTSADLATVQGVVPVLPALPKARAGGAWLPRRTSGEDMVRLWRAQEVPISTVAHAQRGRLWLIDDHGIGNPWKKVWGRWGGGDRDVVSRSWTEWAKQLRAAGLEDELSAVEAIDDVALHAIDELRRCARLVEALDEFQGVAIAGDTVPQAAHLDALAEALSIREPHVLGREVARG